MNKLKSAILLLLLVLTFVSCSKNDYANVVPANATFVASINMASIAEKGDLGNSKLTGLLKDNMSIIFSAESQKQMNKYIESPKDMGIDLREPVYLFQTPNHCVGIAMKMLDKGDFEDFIKVMQKQNIASKAKENDGIMMGSFLDDMQYGYDGKTILLLGSLGDAGRSAVKQTFIQLFNQDEDDSFRSTDSFDKLEEDKRDIAFFTNMAALPEKVAMTFKTLIPDGVRSSDINFFSSLDFQNGRVMVSSKLFGNNDKASKLLEEKEKTFKKIEGRYTNMPTSNTFVWACWGVNGEKVLPMLKQEHQLKMGLMAIERAIDIEAMIKAMDGDLAMTLPFSSFVTGGISPLICAQIKNDKFLDDVDYWQKSMKDYGMSMTKTAKNEYHVKGAGEDFRWGVDGDDLFIATESSWTTNANSTKTNVLDKYKEQIKESMMFAYIDLNSVFRSMSALPISFNGINIKNLPLHAVTISSKTMRDVEASIEIGDGKENCLKELFAK